MAAEKILIIDDIESNRYSVRRLLTHAGYIVAESETIAKGLTALSDFKPDMLILDVKLPDGNGFAVCSMLKSDPNSHSMPILMTSASFVEGRDKAYGLESGADGYLTTPYDPVELIATVRSLLRVRAVEEKLRKSQELFRTIADSIPALVWMAGTDKQFFYFNKLWCSFTGRTIEQESGNGWTEGVHADDLKRCMTVFEEAFSKRESFEMTYRLRRQDGKYRWILDRGEPHYNPDGSFAGYTGACIDIDDKLKAEQKLRENEERFELAMKGMNDGLWDWDLISNEIYYGPRYKSMLGYSETEFPNKLQSWLDHMHSDDRQNAETVVKRYLEGAIPEYRSVFRLKHKDGDYRWILSRAIAVRNAEGKAVRLVGGHTDITEQKELERELRDASERADAANRAKTDFLANMSHEIRTPMNAIIGLAHILTSTSLTDKQKKFVDTLQVSASSMMELINDMLDIAKIEDNMIELESIAFSLRELIQGVVSMMAVKANEKSLGLVVEYGKNVGDSFLGDPVRIQQIVVNLVSNAIKFTAHGTVTIAITEDDTTDESQARLTLKISDTGIGIPEEKLYSIFDKFTQADTSITRKYGGSGLGLTICKALVEHMSGNIHVVSQTNKGSVFTVNITLKKGSVLKSVANASLATVRETSDHVASKSNHILLVEDYKANIMVATAILASLGYQYDVAIDGKEAIQKLMNNSYDAVLMDIQMQDMDGYEATRRIREWEQQKKLRPMPIIAMTAHALMGDREKCLQAGMNDYISKPFNPIELEKKLASYIKADLAA